MTTYEHAMPGINDYAMVPWGNVGITIIFAIGMLALVRWKHRLQPIAAVTLTSVAALHRDMGRPGQVSSAQGRV